MTAAAAPLRRRFHSVQGRRVHCLRIGSGPPAVLVHSSPVNAWYVEPQMRMLAARHTCYAFDTPGFGLSQALPGDSLTVADLAQALADNMAALGLPPCPVYGSHTGAAIALSLGARHPERVTALVLDGVPVFTAQEFLQLFDGYFEPLVPDARGGHYASTWTRFRDQYTWFPWTSRSPAQHNATDLGDAAALHAWMLSFFYASSSYAPAYRAAIAYGQQAVTDAAALRCPAVFMATPTDMLRPHLARLPPLRAQQQIRHISGDKQAANAVIAEVFDRWPAVGPAPAQPGSGEADFQPGQQFLDFAHGQLLVRQAGQGAAPPGPPILLLHDAPGTAAQHEALVLALAAQHRVLAPDLPGCGESDPLPPADAALGLSAWADVLAQACTQAGVDRVCVYGIGIGASLALVLAQRHPARVQSVVLRGLALPDDADRLSLQQHYAPPITLQPDGSHWYRTWLMLRDMRIWYPWFDTRAQRLRRVPGDFDAQRLHQHTFDVMKRHASHAQVIAAALAHDAAASLADLTGRGLPLALCLDPQIPFHAYAERLLALAPAARRLPADDHGHGLALAAFLGAAA